MFVSFLSWDLKYTGLVTNLGPVPFVPWGTSQRFGKSKNTQREGFYCPGHSVGSGSKRDNSPDHLLLDVEEEVDGVACADPDDLTLPLLPDFAFFLGTSNSAEIGSQYKAFSFRTDNLSKTCW